MGIFIKEKGELKTIELERRLMYYASLVMLVFLALAAVVFLVFGDRLINSDMACNFRSTTGFYCPGCGGTRAFYYLVHLKIWKSIKYHFVVFYGVTAILLYAVNGFLYRRIRKLNFLLNPFVLLCAGAILLLIRVVVIDAILLFGGIALI